MYECFLKSVGLNAAAMLILWHSQWNIYKTCNIYGKRDFFQSECSVKISLYFTLLCCSMKWNVKPDSIFSCTHIKMQTATIIQSIMRNTASRCFIFHLYIFFYTNFFFVSLRDSRLCKVGFLFFFFSNNLNFILFLINWNFFLIKNNIFLAKNNNFV